MRSRGFARKAAPFVLGLVLAAPFRSPAAAEQVEVLTGTVTEQDEGILHLEAVRFEDETIPPRDVKIFIDPDTTFYDGTVRVTKESIAPGLRVLVRWVLVGSKRKAVLVRIIGKPVP